MKIKKINSHEDLVDVLKTKYKLDENEVNATLHILYNWDTDKTGVRIPVYENRIGIYTISPERLNELKEIPPKIINSIKEQKSKQFISYKNNLLKKLPIKNTIYIESPIDNFSSMIFRTYCERIYHIPYGHDIYQSISELTEHSFQHRYEYNSKLILYKHNAPVDNKYILEYFNTDKIEKKGYYLIVYKQIIKNEYKFVIRSMYFGDIGFYIQGDDNCYSIKIKESEIISWRFICD